MLIDLVLFAKYYCGKNIFSYLLNCNMDIGYGIYILDIIKNMYKGIYEIKKKV